MVNFGSFSSYTYNPWGTLPFLQLPGWSAVGVYSVIAGLFVIYALVLLGSFVPGLGSLANRIAGKYKKKLEQIFAFYFAADL